MIKLGMADETFKHYHGVFNDSTQTRVRRYPKEIWDTYPQAFAVPGGRDVFACRDLKLQALRGSFAEFQAAVTCDNAFILTLSERACFSMERDSTRIRLEWFGDGPAATIQIIQYIKGDDRSLIGDILSDRDSAAYARHETSMVWVQLETPESTRPGLYRGGIRAYESDLFGDERLCGQLDYELEVLDYILPPMAESRFELDLWQHVTSLARQYAVERFSDAHFAILERFIVSLARLGQRSISIIASDAPWAGQMCHRCPEDGADMYEYNMVRIRRDQAGVFHYDFSVMQRYIELCMAHGIDRRIEIFGLSGVWQDEEYGFGKMADDHPDAVRLRYYDEIDGCCKWMRSGAHIDMYIAALQDYFIQSGLIDRVTIFTDEPMDFALFERILERIHRVAPAFRFSAAISHTEHIIKMKNMADYFSVALASVGEEWEKLQALVLEQKPGQRPAYTWYVCCKPPFPNMFLSSRLLESRLIGFLTDYLHLDGFLRWNYFLYNRTPLTDGRWHTYNAGDTNFVYPGPNGVPLLSLRYIQLMRGTEDYRLLEQLRLRFPQKADNLLKNIYAAMFHNKTPRELLCPAAMDSVESVYCMEYSVYEAARKAIIEALTEE